MPIIDHLAFSQNRRDEIPNVELAEKLAAKNDSAAVKELVALLEHKKKDIRHDALKVLYETASRRPALVAPHWKAFLPHLQSKQNRMAWGAMTALDHVTEEVPKEIFGVLGQIMEAADTGSVITRDHAVGILAKLAADKKYAPETFPVLLEILRSCPDMQFPMYCEMSVKAISADNKQEFTDTLKKRLGKLEKDSQKKRVEKVLKKLSV